MYPSHTPLGSIVTGKNPRKYFDPAEMAEIEASVKLKGIIQSLLLRPSPTLADKFEIVAGERRFRAAKKVLSDEYQVPCLIKDMTDAEAAEHALIENVQRAQMSPTEEAEAAAHILASSGGDQDEAARRLGWSRSTLQKRLALMNCSESVRTALNERKIQLGHAELLASAPRDKQDQALESIIKNAIPVAKIKEMLAQIAKSMSTAIFDKTECASCKHNSDFQSALFGESVGSGFCTNGTCYTAKTEAELAIRCDALKESYPRVEIVRPGDNFTVIHLVAVGTHGVGEEQAKACRGCAKFGAAISAVPDKLGKVFTDQCFDIACNSLKVAARIKSEKPAPSAEKVATTGKDKASTSAGKKLETEKKEAPATVQDSNRLKEYRVKIWRAVTKKELMSKPDMNLAVLIGMGMVGEMRHVSSAKLTDGFGKLMAQKSVNFIGNLSEAISSAAGLPEDKRKIMIMGIAASAMDLIEEKRLIEIMQFLQVDMKIHWKLNQEFLSLLTKSEMEVLAEEIGLKPALGDKFTKTMKLKNDEIIKVLLAVEGFEYTGLVPRSMEFANA